MSTSGVLKLNIHIMWNPRRNVRNMRDARRELRDMHPGCRIVHLERSYPRSVAGGWDAEIEVRTR